MGVGGLGTHAQFTLPYGIGEYKFGCQHPAPILSIAVNVTVFQFVAPFCFLIAADALLPEPGAIEVDAQFPDLADIVDIGIMVGYGSVVDVHPLTDLTLQLSIAVDGLPTVQVATAIEFAKPFVGHTEGVVFVDVITQTCLAGYGRKPDGVRSPLVDMDGVLVEEQVA